MEISSPAGTTADALEEHKAPAMVSPAMVCKGLLRQPARHQQAMKGSL